MLKNTSHGTSGSWRRPAQGQFHATFPQPVGDGAGVRHGPGQAVEFGHDQGVALAHGGEGLIEAGAGAAGAGEAVVGVDAVLGDAEIQERLALGGQVLAVGGAAGVSDEGCGHGVSVHGESVRTGSRIRNGYRTIHMRRCWLGLGGGRGDRLRRPLDGPLTGSVAPDRRAPASGPHLTPWVGPDPAHRRILVAKTPIATLAYDPALYRNRPVLQRPQRAGRHGPIRAPPTRSNARAAGSRAAAWSAATPGARPLARRCGTFDRASINFDLMLSVRKRVTPFVNGIE